MDFPQDRPSLWVHPLSALAADPADQPARTAAIREVFTHIKADPYALVALAPEGRDFPGGVLGMPPAGSGKFLLELSRRLGPVYPVGIFEEGGCATFAFWRSL